MAVSPFTGCLLSPASKQGEVKQTGERTPSHLIHPWQAMARRMGDPNWPVQGSIQGPPKTGTFRFLEQISKMIPVSCSFSN